MGSVATGWDDYLDTVSAGAGAGIFPPFWRSLPGHSPRKPP